MIVLIFKNDFKKTFHKMCKKEHIKEKISIKLLD